MSIIIAILLFFSFFGFASVTVSDDGATVQEPVISQESGGGGGERLIGTLPGAAVIGVSTDQSITLYRGNAAQGFSGTVPPGEIVMTDDEPPVMLAGDQAGCMADLPGSLLQRSEDGGQTWSTEADAAPMRPLAIWSDGLAVASDCAGLHLSTDAGLTWTAIDGIPVGFDVTAFSAVAGVEPSRIVLVGLTSEGGTSTLHAIDLTAPATPVVSEGLRQYYAIGGLAGTGETYVQVGMDGAWISTDAGATWERQSEGLEGLVLERDPLEFGLPQDFDPRSAEMDAVVVSGDTLIAGTNDGLFQRPLTGTTWVQVPGRPGRSRPLPSPPIVQRCSTSRMECPKQSRFAPVRACFVRHSWV